MHTFRCLDSGHLICEPKDVRGPLASRQSTWCAAHDCPAVGIASESANVAAATGS